MLKLSSIKKRYLSLAITILAVLAFVSSGTYALFKWTSSSNPDVSINANLGIVYNKETSVLTGSLNPTTNKEGGISTTIELWTTNTNTQIYGTLFLNISNITTYLNTNNMLKWEIWTGSTKINEGTFNGFTSGDILELFKDEILNSTQTFYTIYIWLDDNMINTTSISGGTISAEVGATAGQLPVSDSTITIVNNSASQDNYVQDYTLNLTATSSGYAIRGYAITTGPQTPTEFTQITNPTATYNFEQTVNENRNYYVWFKTQDNKTAYEMVGVTHIDNKPPVIAINGDLTTQYINSSSNITIPLKITEVLSGINSSTFTSGDISVQVGMTNTNPSTKNLSYLTENTGIYTYNLQLAGLTGNGTLSLNTPTNAVTDIANNQSSPTTLTTNIIVDNTAPTINNITASSLGNMITITVNASDNLSGINTYWYSIDGTNYYSSTNSNYTFSNVSNGTYVAHVYVKDMANNTSTITEEEILFDTTPPALSQVSVTTPSGTYSNGQIINIVSTFTENINNSTGGPITASNAPTLALRFGSAPARNATFVSANENTITYQITIDSSDLGALAINSYSGTVYDNANNSLSITTPSITGNSVSASTKAKIGSTYYPTLANAISASGTTKTIQMINNTAECVTIPSANNVTLDLNSKTITCNTTNVSAITNNGTLNITSTTTPGTITSSHYVVNNTGSLTLTKGTLQATSATAIYNNSTATNASGTSLYINGATVISTSSYGINNVKTGIVTIASGTVKGQTTGIYNTTTGTINVGLASETLSTTSPEVYSTGSSHYGVYMNSGGTLNLNNGAIYAANTSVTSAYYKNNCNLTARSGHHITSANATVSGVTYKKSSLVSGTTIIQYRGGDEYCSSYECCGTTTETETSSCVYTSPGSGWTRQSGSCDSSLSVTGTCKCRGGYTGSRTCSSSWATTDYACINWCESMGASDAERECTINRTYAYRYTRTVTTPYCESGRSRCSGGETSECESYDTDWGSWSYTMPTNYDYCQRKTCNLDVEGNLTGVCSGTTSC